jgi:hypothetical protein
VRFRSTVELGGKTATGIPVPAEVVAALGSHKRPAVRVTLGAHSYRSTVAPMGGRFMFPVSAENRAGAGVAAGDEVDVELELDTEPRELAVPPDYRRLREVKRAHDPDNVFAHNPNIPPATAARYPSAQGTSTESSVGESRATTYSAASASDRF